MKLHILQEAEEELSGAIQYYEDITPGLGIRLKTKLNKKFIGMRTTMICHVFGQKDTEGSTVNHFPIISPALSAKKRYSLVAIANGYKRPEYWIERKC